MNNRIYKFRAWDEIYKRFKTGFNLAYEGEILVGENNTDGDTDSELFNFNQFIGLYDKNGKEIYEGDIVRFDYIEERKEIMSVCFDDGMFGFLIEGGFYPLSEYLNQNLEVIGNIYENPELLKQ